MSGRDTRGKAAEKTRHNERVRIAFDVDIEWTDSAREWAVDAAIGHCAFLSARGAGVKGSYSVEYASAEEVQGG